MKSSWQPVRKLYAVWVTVWLFWGCLWVFLKSDTFKVIVVSCVFEGLRTVEGLISWCVVKHHLIRPCVSILQSNSVRINSIIDQRLIWCLLVKTQQGHHLTALCHCHWISLLNMQNVIMMDGHIYLLNLSALWLILPCLFCLCLSLRRYETSAVCSDLQGEILKCYRENAGKTLQCSNIASRYLQCVNNAKQVSVCICIPTSYLLVDKHKLRTKNAGLF